MREILKCGCGIVIAQVCIVVVITEEDDCDIVSHL